MYQVGDDDDIVNVVVAGVPTRLVYFDTNRSNKPTQRVSLLQSKLKTNTQIALAIQCCPR
jgi:hypothetical protein